MAQLKLRGRWAVGRLACALVVALTTGMAANDAVAQQVIVIGDDRGGMIGARAQVIEQIIAANARVEIRGSVCYSACTMYLGAGNVCISPATTFGFHGPSRDGQSLTPREFDHWSSVMARYYPEPLRRWYLQTARFTPDMVRINGSAIVRYGVQTC